MSKSKVLFILTGSIACYKACHAISRLVQAQCDVQVVATPAALQFVGNATIEGLTSRPVISDMYQAGNVMDHIHLMRWADLIVVAPATASFINKAASGIADDLVQTLFLAHDFTKPLLVAPAMNVSMYNHQITQNSIKTLISLGIQIIDSATGNLACGEEGKGRLVEPDILIQNILSALKMKNVENKISQTNTSPAATNLSALGKIKILVTAGGTQEPVDDVRVLSNNSTGKTGAKLAEFFVGLGIETTLLRSQFGVNSEIVTDTQSFTSFKDLNEKIQNLLSQSHYTHVIHTAAVSDYSVSSISSGTTVFEASKTTKLSSENEEMSIHLKRNPKIVSKLREYAKNPQLQVFAFKLTSQASDEARAQAVQKLFKNSAVDLVIHNDLSEINKTQGTHRFTVYSQTENIVCENFGQLSTQLAKNILAKEAI